MTKALFFRCRRGQRLGLVDDVNPDEFQRLVADNLGVVRDARGDLPGIAGFQMLGFLVLDDEINLAIEHIADFRAG